MYRQLLLLFYAFIVVLNVVKLIHGNKNVYRDEAVCVRRQQSHERELSKSICYALHKFFLFRFTTIYQLSAVYARISTHESVPCVNGYTFTFKHYDADILTTKAIRRERDGKGSRATVEMTSSTKLLLFINRWSGCVKVRLRLTIQTAIQQKKSGVDNN